MMETNFKSQLTWTAILLGSCLMLFACSENSAGVKEKEQLHLQASDSVISVGSKVSFEVTANGRAVDADIYIDRSKINGSTYTFNEAGKYTAIAKKEGYINSEKIKISVTPIEDFGFSSIYVTKGDVYIAGYVPLAAIPHRPTPLYWKNGKLHHLGGNGVLATSIYVSNGDVYIAGYSTYPINRYGAVYWKNGTPHELNLSGKTNSIYVSKGDVYVAGVNNISDVEEAVVATYWKNGTPHKLTDGRETAAKSIYFSKGDVYVAGAKGILSSSGIDFYWKNETRHKLSISGEAEAMDVSGGNVYVAGYEMVDSAAVAAYWENGARHRLSDGRANFIKVIGGNVHVAGWECDETRCIVKYWKNETLVSKYEISGSPALSRAFISNGDVYVVGTVGGKPFYWKNGTPHKLDIE